jgi:class 3 adenylate cyclase
MAVASIVGLIWLLGLLGWFDQWAYESITALGGVESLQTEPPAEVADGEPDSPVGEPSRAPLHLPSAHPVLTFALIAAAALTAVYSAGRVRPAAALGLVATLTFCYGLLVLITFLLTHRLLEVWTVPLALTLGYGVTAADTSVQARGQRRFVRQLFSRHVPPDLARAIWRRREEFLPGGRLHSQKLTATVLFAGMRRFAALSETVDARTLTEWVNDYMAAMARVVVDHGGIVDNYFGDALKADFGVPFARATSDDILQDASQGVACALAMGEALQVLNRRWQDRGFPPIDLRVGLSTGEVVAACIGRSQPLKFTTMGDVVDFAGHLERYPCAPEDPALGPGSCRILIGAATAAKLSARFWLHRIGAAGPEHPHHPPVVYRVYGQNERLMPAAGSDLRQSSRVEVTTPVTLVSGPPATAVTHNVSIGGMAICRLAHPLPVGSTTVLRFDVPGHARPIKATGTIVWAREDRAGIAFSGLPPSVLVTLESFLVQSAHRK